MRWLILSLLLYASGVAAEDFPERRVPDVKTTTIQNVEYKCYAAPQYAELLLLSSDYQALRHIYYLNLPKTYTDVNKLYELKLQLKEDEIVYLSRQLEDARVQLVTNYEAEEKAIRKLQLSATGWKVLAGVEAALFVAMTGYAIFK